MRSLWTLGGLSISDLVRRTVRESWQDAVFGQGGRMAFYHFLAIFPSLLIFLAVSTRVPYVGDHMKNALRDLSAEVLPDQVSQLFQRMMDELNEHTLSGLRLISACLGASWAALNGTWAMIYGLNRAYEVDEHRTWRELSITIAGLTLFLAVTGSVAVFLILCGAHLPAGPHLNAAALRVLEWLVVVASLTVSFSLLYRFAPNLRDPEWRWSTPGALCALVLWIAATVGVRFYFDHVNDYASSYGHLNGVAMLLLWLYVTNGAILIGGEMNSEIEKAVEEGRNPADRCSPTPRRSGP
jgi:membrane protein